MAVLKSETHQIRTGDDIVRVRQLTRKFATEVNFSLIDQTKIITAASEIGRNTLEYGGGGQVVIEIVIQGPQKGVRLTFTDEGPGIADIDLAMTDGYTSKGGLGLGLSGAKRLSSEFQIESVPGKGTKVVFARWI